MPTDHTAFIDQFGRKSATTWSAWRRSNYAFFEDQLASLPHSSALTDLGAGALHFADLFTQFDYTGVDFMEYPHVSVIADLTKPLPLPDAAADIVTLSNTLEHIPDPVPLLSECRRLLKREGRIVGTVPFLLPVHQAPYDFNRYTHLQLEKLLTEAGFSDVRVVSLGSQIDVYDTIELKTFDALISGARGPALRTVLRLARLLRRAGMRILRFVAKDIPAGTKVTEGYGFSARA